MESMYLTIGLFVLLHNVADGQLSDTCRPIQHLEIGSMKLLDCAFVPDFYGVFWYDSIDIVNTEPILNYKEGERSGAGYTSGEYDVAKNGSLIIKKVRYIHELNFTAVFFKTQSQDPSNFVVHVITIVKPSVPFPAIDKCGNDQRICVTVEDEGSQIACTVEGAKPLVRLQWVQRVTHEERVLTFRETTENVNGTFTSNAFLTIANPDDRKLSLYICKATSLPEVLISDESLVLVQAGHWTDQLQDLEIVWTELGHHANFICVNETVTYLVWNKISNDSVHQIAVLISRKSTIHYKASKNVYLNENGVLSIGEIRLEQEGIYACISYNGIVERVRAYQSFVYVTPEYSHPVVEGCIPSRPCTLKINKTGILTCSFSGVRPSVELEWKTLNESDSTLIHFFDVVRHATKKSFTYNVIITTKYQLREQSTQQLVLRCAVSGNHSSLFRNSKTNVLLIFSEEPHQDDGPDIDSTSRIGIHEGTSMELFIVVSLAAFALIIIMGITITLCLRVRKKYRRSKSIPTTDEELRSFLPLYSAEDEKRGKTKLFLEEIRTSYENMYSNITPLPLMRNESYEVDALYVDCGLELKINSIKGRNEYASLKSYHCLFNDKRIKDHVSVIEGDPGHGKSILCLKVTHDWYTGNTTSPVKKFDIVLLIRLRYWKHVNSIFDFIKTFLLPKDSSITKDDIVDIINSAESLLIIFDGYDEFPKQGEKSDVYDILGRSMFQKCQVIVTTRTKCIPAEMTTKRKDLRLTGFNELTRLKYVERITDGNNVGEIVAFLQQNSILVDICRVPLFFVTYVHLKLKEYIPTDVHSVTSFFTYIVSSFHKHYYLKLSLELDEKIVVKDWDQGKLGKLAFESITENRTHWTKKYLRDVLGEQLYMYYLSIGILMEQDVFQSSSDLQGLQYDIIDNETNQVTFYHKIFCEWYAAHYLSRLLENASPAERINTLKMLDPFNLQYLYRFTCGLKPNEATEIIKYLQSLHDGNMFAILCTLEQTGEIESIAATLGDLCVDNFLISVDNSRLVQRSTLQLVEIASKMKIPIGRFHLENCLAKVDLDQTCIQLVSGLVVTKLARVTELKITEVGRELTHQEAASIITFSLLCDVLTTLTLEYCLLPKKIEDRLVLQKIEEKNVSVLWIPTTQFYQMDPSGLWKARYGNKRIISDSDYEKQVNEFLEEWRNEE